MMEWTAEVCEELETMIDEAIIGIE